MAWVRQYSAANHVGARKLQALIFYAINPLLTKSDHFAFLSALFRGIGPTYAVYLRLIRKLVVDFLLVILELFSLGAFVLSQFTRLTDRQTDRQTDAHGNTAVA